MEILFSTVGPTCIFLMMSNIMKCTFGRQLRYTYWLYTITCGVKTTSESILQDCYNALGVSPSSSLTDVRAAYIAKAKRYHPDSGLETANQEKFAKIDQSYKILKNHLKKENEQEDFEDEIENVFDIKHVAPQHRQYLNFEGIGYGNPSQRQAQYQQFKVSRAVDNIHQRRVEKLASETENRLVFRNKQEAKKHKISNAIDRLAEDLIQQSMSKGEFNNLKGMGKPLNLFNDNPYIDTATQKINEILKTEGFQPEWISLQKEISTEIQNIKNKLIAQKSKFGTNALTNSEKSQWNKYLSDLEKDVKNINTKIDNFNLIVPILTNQKMHISLEKLVRKLFKDEEQFYYTP